MKKPRTRFYFYGHPFIPCGNQTWFSLFKDQKVIAYITEVFDYIKAGKKEDLPIYFCVLYHNETIISQSFGVTPTDSLLKARLHEYLLSVEKMNIFMDTVTNKSEYNL